MVTDGVDVVDACDAILSKADDVATPVTRAALIVAPLPPPDIAALKVAVIVAPDETAAAFCLYQISADPCAPLAATACE